MKNGLVSLALIPSQVYSRPCRSVSTNFSNIWAVLHFATCQFFIKAFTDIDSSFPTNKPVKRKRHILATYCVPDNVNLSVSCYLHQIFE